MHLTIRNEIFLHCFLGLCPLKFHTSLCQFSADKIITLINYLYTSVMVSVPEICELVMHQKTRALKIY